MKTLQEFIQNKDKKTNDDFKIGDDVIVGGGVAVKKWKGRKGKVMRFNQGDIIVKVGRGEIPFDAWELNKV